MLSQNILQRVVNTGEYRPDKVKPSLSPSMDIQVSSNFERLLFYILKNVIWISVIN